MSINEGTTSYNNEVQTWRRGWLGAPKRAHGEWAPTDPPQLFGVSGENIWSITTSIFNNNNSNLSSKAVAWQRKVLLYTIRLVVLQERNCTNMNVTVNGQLDLVSMSIDNLL